MQCHQTIIFAVALVDIEYDIRPMQDVIDDMTADNNNES